MYKEWNSLEGVNFAFEATQMLEAINRNMFSDPVAFIIMSEAIWYKILKADIHQCYVGGYNEPETFMGIKVALIRHRHEDNPTYTLTVVHGYQKPAEGVYDDPIRSDNS